MAFLENLRSSKVTDRLIYVMAFGVGVLGVLAYFVAPLYKDGAAIALDGFKYGLTGSLGFKFGITIPGGSAPGSSTGAITVKCPHCSKSFDAASQLAP